MFPEKKNPDTILQNSVGSNLKVVQYGGGFRSCEKTRVSSSTYIWVLDSADEELCKTLALGVLEATW